jgi:hypothetical protein
MKVNPNWDRAVGIVAAAVGIAICIFVFLDVRNPLVYLAIFALTAYAAHRRMSKRETPFERQERAARRMRM